MKLKLYLIFQLLCLSTVAQDVLLKSNKHTTSLDVVPSASEGFTTSPEVEALQKAVLDNTKSNVWNKVVADTPVDTKVDNSYNELATPTVDLKQNGSIALYLLSYTNWQAELQKKINTIKAGLDTIRTVPLLEYDEKKKAIDDPLLALRDSINISIYTINSIHTVYDTVYSFPQRKKHLEELAKLSSKVIAVNEQSLQLSNDIRDQYNKQNKVYEEQIAFIDATLKNIQKYRMESPLYSMNTPIKLSVVDKGLIDKISAMVKLIQPLVDNLYLVAYPDIRKSIAKGTSTSADFIKEFNQIKASYNEWYKSFSKYVNDNFKESDKTVESEFGAIPSVSQLLGDVRAPTINISVLGSRTIYREESNSTLSARIFTSSVPLNLSTARSIFLPEVSTFGSQIKYSGARRLTVENEKNKSSSKFITNIGINGELNFLNKRLSADTDTLTSAAKSIDNLIAQIRLGAEIVVFKEFFSIYGNLNGIGLLDNTDKFHGYFKDTLGNEFSRIVNKNGWFFFDVGARLWLNPSAQLSKQLSNSGVYIVADFNLIFPQVWGRQIIQHREDVTGSDKIIPVVRLGIQKSLGTLLKK